MPAMDRGGYFARFRRKPKNKSGNSGSTAQQGQTLKTLDVSSNVDNATAVQQRSSFVEPEPSSNFNSRRTEWEPSKLDPMPGTIATKRDYWAEDAECLRKTKPDDHKKLEVAIQEGSNAPGTLEEQIRQILSNNIATITD